jgi:hypothetical protein
MSSIIAVLIRTATFLDQALLFVVILALLTPLWRLILAILLFLIALLLGLVDSSAVMLRGTVNSHELQRLGLRCVDELVLSAGWYHDDI